MDINDAKSMATDELMSMLKSSHEGLSEQEAQIRLAENGYNELKEKKPNPALKFLKRFYGPVPLLLWIVILISYFLHNFRNLYIVLALLIFNALAGFAEEYKADKSIDLLKQKLSTYSRARRSGAWVKISSRLIVPGDVLRLRIGDIVPADCKVIESESLEADESPITGESLPVSKNNGDLAYSGSVIKRGEATVMVFATGTNTLYGKTAEIVASASPVSHLEGVVLNITKYLILADIVIISIMFIYGISSLRIDLGDLLSLMLVIFIASVPVALPAAFTVSMALGTEKLVKKNVLVTKLSSIEETSTMNILCFDKTGTLTTNKITVKKIRPFNTGEDEVLRYAAEASRRSDNDPIDNAILDFASSRAVKTGRQLRFSPFDPSTKRTEAEVIDEAGNYLVMKGAAKIISGLFPLDK
jgi:H+-transporting ATPase